MLVKLMLLQGSEFYNNSFKKWLEDNYIEMNLIHNKEKSVIGRKIY